MPNKKTTKKKTIKKKLAKKKAKPQKKIITQALVIKQIELAQTQKDLIQQPTPSEFIKERKARGNQTVKYVEGGYVLAQLNSIFGSLNWEFKIIEKEIVKDLKTVWVYGELTIIDHAKGHRVTKGQYGQHDFANNVPLGDTLKAAGTDALKKCASMFGIALDVYWQQLDNTPAIIPPKESKPKTLTNQEAFEQATSMIKRGKNADVLIEIDKRIQESKLYDKKQKEELHKLINKQVDIITPANL